MKETKELTLEDNEVDEYYALQKSFDKKVKEEYEKRISARNSFTSVFFVYAVLLLGWIISNIYFCRV